VRPRRAYSEAVDRTGAARTLESRAGGFSGEYVGQLPFSRTKPYAAPARNVREEPRPAWLVRAIESQIVPRLLMHAASSRRQDVAGLTRWRPSIDDVSEFADLLIAHDVTVAMAYVQAWRQQGAILPTLYLELLAPTASHLRQRRVEGRLGLTRMVLARYRLLRVVRALREGRTVVKVSATAE